MGWGSEKWWVTLKGARVQISEKQSEREHRGRFFEPSQDALEEADDKI